MAAQLRELARKQKETEEELREEQLNAKAETREAIDRVEAKMLKEVRKVLQILKPIDTGKKDKKGKKKKGSDDD